MSWFNDDDDPVGPDDEFRPGDEGAAAVAAHHPIRRHMMQQQLGQRTTTTQHHQRGGPPAAPPSGHDGRRSRRRQQQEGTRASGGGGRGGGSRPFDEFEGPDPSSSAPAAGPAPASSKGGGRTRRDGELTDRDRNRGGRRDGNGDDVHHHHHRRRRSDDVARDAAGREERRRRHRRVQSTPDHPHEDAGGAAGRAERRDVQRGQHHGRIQSTPDQPPSPAAAADDGEDAARGEDRRASARGRHHRRIQSTPDQPPPVGADAVEDTAASKRERRGARRQRHRRVNSTPDSADAEAPRPGREAAPRIPRRSSAEAATASNAGAVAGKSRSRGGEGNGSSKTGESGKPPPRSSSDKSSREPGPTAATTRSFAKRGPATERDAAAVGVASATAAATLGNQRRPRQRGVDDSFDRLWGGDAADGGSPGAGRGVGDGRFTRREGGGGGPGRVARSVPTSAVTAAEDSKKEEASPAAVEDDDDYSFWSTLFGGSAAEESRKTAQAQAQKGRGGVASGGVDDDEAPCYRSVASFDHCGDVADASPDAAAAVLAGAGRTAHAAGEERDGGGEIGAAGAGAGVGAFAILQSLEETVVPTTMAAAAAAATGSSGTLPTSPGRRPLEEDGNSLPADHPFHPLRSARRRRKSPFRRGGGGRNPAGGISLGDDRVSIEVVSDLELGPSGRPPPPQTRSPYTDEVAAAAAPIATKERAVAGVAVSAAKEDLDGSTSSTIKTVDSSMEEAEPARPQAHTTPSALENGGGLGKNGVAAYTAAPAFDVDDDVDADGAPTFPSKTAPGGAATSSTSSMRRLQGKATSRRHRLFALALGIALILAALGAAALLVDRYVGFDRVVAMFGAGGGDTQGQEPFNFGGGDADWADDSSKDDEDESYSSPSSPSSDGGGAAPTPPSYYPPQSWTDPPTSAPTPSPMYVDNGWYGPRTDHPTAPPKWTWTPPVVQTSSPVPPPAPRPTYEDTDDDDGSISFYVMGDTPYNEREKILLIEQLEELDQSAKFAIHLGDLNKAADTMCAPDEIRAAHYILRQSPIPLKVVPGDNDWSDCPYPNSAWSLWYDLFYRFDRYWDHDLPMVEQRSRPENFAFVLRGVLFVGLHIVGGEITMTNNYGAKLTEWDERLADCVTFTRRTIETYRGDGLRSVMIFGHSRRRSNNRPYFDPMREMIQELLPTDTPVFYVHGDGHYWSFKQPWEEKYPNIWDVMVDAGGDAPPLKITINEEGHPDGVFTFDRQGGPAAYEN